ncbi:MAG: YbjN domain-containing protein [Clostridia bacterium]|nr:YbjN domain-containing protein [Clostridia bacterium]
MAYSQELTDQLRACFAAAGINAAFEDKGGTGLFTIRMKLRCKIQTAQMLVIVREDNFSTLTQLPLAADENSRLAVAEYLTRVNFNMRNGNFELNMDDGEIRFKTYVHVGKQPLDSGAAKLSVMLPFLMLDRFGDGLLEVLFGFKSPREAFEAIQNS